MDGDTGMNKIVTISDVMMMLSEINTEIRYHGGNEMKSIFDRIISEWGFNPQDFEQ